MKIGDIVRFAVGSNLGTIGTVLDVLDGLVKLKLSNFVYQGQAASHIDQASGQPAVIQASAAKLVAHDPEATMPAIPQLDAATLAQLPTPAAALAAQIVPAK